MPQISSRTMLHIATLFPVILLIVTVIGAAFFIGLATASPAPAPTTDPAIRDPGANAPAQVTDDE